jgi:RNA polymerase sigma factor (TIGR02999 family)
MRVTQLLSLASDGDSRATDELLPVVYEELRRMARAQLSTERAGPTLQPTVLVHEAYLKLVGGNDVSWNSRGHFFGAAAQAMRRILVDRARTNNAIKRGGGRERVELADQAMPAEPGPGAMLQIDEALQRLEAYDAVKARIVMLRFFSGLTIEEIARAMDMTVSQVKTAWDFSRAWLHAQLKQMDIATPDRPAGPGRGASA